MKERIINFFCFQNWKNTSFNFAKTIFVFLIFNFLIIPNITLAYFGFKDSYINSLPLVEIPNNIQTIRSIWIFILLWNIFLYFWIVKIINSYFYFCKKCNLSKEKIFIFSFFPFFNLFLIPYILNKKILPGDIKNYFFSLFEKDKELIKFNKNNPFVYYLNLVVLIVFLPMIVLIWFISTTSEAGGSIKEIENQWFQTLQYFTIQTNLWCFIYLFLFAINKNWKLFKNHTYLIWSITYISIVSITYNCALLPIKFISGDINHWSSLTWIKTMWEHVINPVFFTTYGIIILNLKKDAIKTLSFAKTLKFGYIIPSIYILFAIIGPFITSQSVYGIVTNCNPNLQNNSSFLPYGQWWMAIVVLLYTSVFALSIYVNWIIKAKTYIKSKALLY